MGAQGANTPPLETCSLTVWPKVLDQGLVESNLLVIFNSFLTLGSRESFLEGFIFFDIFFKSIFLKKDIFLETFSLTFLINIVLVSSSQI